MNSGIRTDYEIKKAIIEAIEENITDINALKLLGNGDLPLLKINKTLRKAKEFKDIAEIINKYFEKEAQKSNSPKEENGNIIEAQIKRFKLKKRKLTSTQYNKDFIGEKVIERAWRYIENKGTKNDESGAPTWNKLTLFLNAFGYDFNDFDHLKLLFTDEYIQLRELLNKTQNEDIAINNDKSESISVPLLEEKDAKEQTTIKEIDTDLTNLYQNENETKWTKPRKFLIYSLLITSFFIIIIGFLEMNSVPVFDNLFEKMDIYYLTNNNLPTYNILIAPFRNSETKKISPTGFDLLKRLKQRYNLNKLGLNIEYLSSDTIEYVDIDFNKAKEIGKKKKGNNMVVWFDDSHINYDDSSIKIYLCYVNIDSEKVSHIIPKHDTSFYMVGINEITYMVRINEIVGDMAEGIRIIDVDNVIYWFLGNKFYLNGDYENALNNFRKVYVEPKMTGVRNGS